MLGCLRPELDTLVYQNCDELKNNFWVTNKYKNIKDKLESIFKNSKNFQEYLFTIRGKKGNGYRELALSPIVIPPDKAIKLNRLLVLLGSMKAGNNSPDCLKELSGLLDRLYRNQSNDKITYKYCIKKRRT